MKILITGGCGFIGSHLVDKLINENNENEITIIDNFSIDYPWRNEWFKRIQKKVKVLKSDINKINLNEIKDFDIIFHLAANFSVRKSSEDPKFDLENTFLTTFNILEAMRKNDINKIVFTSSSTVYGEQERQPIPETAELKPISNYGSSKLASEIYIHSYYKLYGIRGLILRLANIIGSRSNHGVIPDFVKKLKENPKELEILGNGKQKKSYLHVYDCINAILLTSKKFDFEIFNVGSEEWITVDEIAKIVSKEMGLNPKFKYTGGERGWKGDVKKFILDISKLKNIGWKPNYNIKEAIKLTIKGLI